MGEDRRLAQASYVLFSIEKDSCSFCCLRREACKIPLIFHGMELEQHSFAAHMTTENGADGNGKALHWWQQRGAALMASERHCADAEGKALHCWHPRDTVLMLKEWRCTDGNGEAQH